MSKRRVELIAGIVVFINKLLAGMKLESRGILASLKSRLGAVRPRGDAEDSEGRIRCSRRRKAAERALNHDGALDEAVGKISGIFAGPEFATDGVVEILVADYLEEMISFAGEKDPRKMVRILDSCW